MGDRRLLGRKETGNEEAKCLPVESKDDKLRTCSGTKYWSCAQLRKLPVRRT
jgi:hypothetical protein